MTIRFEPVIRVNAGNYPSLHSLGVTHIAAFEFECDGSRYWGDCHRTRGAAGVTYDSNIRTNDKNGRSYSLRETQMAPIRRDIGAAMSDAVREYAASLDVAPIVAPSPVSQAPSARAVPGDRAAPVRPSDPLRRALVAEGRTFAATLATICDVSSGAEFTRQLDEWHNRLFDYRARLGWYWEGRQAIRTAAKRGCQCPDCTN